MAPHVFISFQLQLRRWQKKDLEDSLHNQHNRVWAATTDSRAVHASRQADPLFSVITKSASHPPSLQSPFCKPFWPTVMKWRTLLPMHTRGQLLSQAVQTGWAVLPLINCGFDCLESLFPVSPLFNKGEAVRPRPHSLVSWGVLLLQVFWGSIGIVLEIYVET